MELRQFRYVVTVAEVGTFTAAAEMLRVAQPSLSQQVSRLEREVGASLLYRGGAGAVLTASGAAFLPPAKEALAFAEQGSHAIRSLLTAGSRHLTVGFVGSAGTDLLPSAVKAFRSERADASVELRELDFLNYTDLRAAGVDVAFVRLRAAPAGLGLTVLQEQPRVAVLPALHHLAAAQPITMGDLAREGFITKPEAANPQWRREWLAEQHRHGLPGRISAEVRTIQEGLNLVAAGQGVWLVPEPASRVYARADVRYVAVADLDPAVVSIAWPIATAGPLVRGFTRTAVSVAARGRSTSPVESAALEPPLPFRPLAPDALEPRPSTTPEPSLRGLEAFAALAEHLSFTRAGQAQRLSQQTLSGRIARLEDQLGVRVVHRTRRGVTLTAAGHALLVPAQQTVRCADEALRAARRHIPSKRDDERHNSMA